MNTIVRKLPLTAHYKGEQTMCMVEIDIDVEQIALYYGTQAFRNKSRKSRALHGAIEVRAYPCKEQTT